MTTVQQPPAAVGAETTGTETGAALERRGHLAIDPNQTELTPEQRAAFRALGVDPNDPVAQAHCRRFIHVCQMWGVDPWSGEIHLVQRGRVTRDKTGAVSDTRTWTIQVGIDGYRRRAREAGNDPNCPIRLIGGVKWMWSAGGDPSDERAWRPVQDPQTGDVVMHPVWWAAWPDNWPHPAMAKAVAVVEDKKTGKRWTEEFVAHWGMYAVHEQVYENGKRRYDEHGRPVMRLGQFWAKGGAHQLAKCAEAGLLRKLFHGYFHGVYIQEEMAQAEAEAARAEAEVIARLRREAYQAAQEGAQESRPGGGADPAPVQETVAAEGGDEPAGTAGQAADDAEAGPAASAAEGGEPATIPPLEPLTEQQRREYLLDELEWMSGLVGQSATDALVKRAGKPIAAMPTEELQSWVAAFRQVAVAALRSQGRAEEAEVYGSWSAGFAGPVDFLLGRTDTPEGAASGGEPAGQGEPHRFTPEPGDDSRCVECGGYEDDTWHQAA